MSRPHPTPWRPIVVVFGLSLLLGACAGVQRPDPAPHELLEMDPMLVKADPDGVNATRTIVLDSSEIFTNATDAFQRRQYDRAIEQYGQILEHFADSKFYLPSLYNSGLSYERLDRWEDAINAYERVLEHSPGKPEATDALYRMAECQSRMARWKEVVAITDRILDRSGLATYDIVEAWTRRGDALFQLDDLAEAEKAYRAAMKANAQAPEGTGVPQDSHFVVAAEFGISRVYHKLFERVKFVLPVERMETDLEDKVQLFMQAQSNYIRVMRRGNPFWATAAGFHIGRMYEDFYTALLAAEVPDDLSREETDVYFAELRKQIKPLMERALQIYEKNIIMSERYGINNDYTQQTADALDRLKHYIVDDNLQATEQARILRGEVPEIPGKPTDERDQEKPALTPQPPLP